MRIVQIIDSLDAGGAERMAVNYANALSSTIDFSALIATRQEGVLQQQLYKNVPYLFLRKKSAFDIKALLRLRNFVKKNKIAIVHAHGTSIFIVFLLKLIYPKIKLIWHDHYGDSEFLAKRPTFILKLISPFLNCIIVVNTTLKIWAEQNLYSKNVIFLPNFPVLDGNKIKLTALKGEVEKRIICIANLRPQKNHFFLLKIASLLKNSHPTFTFHLIGKDFEDHYSTALKKKIIELKLENNVFLYGSRNDIQHLLNQSLIAILTSKSEGLPVSFLEYGMLGKPIIVTAVGELPSIINNNHNGIIVPSDNATLFYDAIIKYINNGFFRIQMGENLKTTIDNNYTESAIIEKYINIINGI